jgi:hypothetical protein
MLEAVHVTLKRADPNLAPRTQKPANAAVGRAIDPRHSRRSGNWSGFEHGLADSATSVLIGHEPVELLLGCGGPALGSGSHATATYL